MQIEKKQKIHLIYGIVLSVLLVISAACFIIGAYSIYRSSDRDPYTYESIGRTFSYIAIPIFLTVATVIGGIVIRYVFPLPDQLVKARRESKTALAVLAKKLDLSAIEPAERLVITKERKLRRLLLAINIALFDIGGAVSLIFALIPSNFTGDYNASVIGLVLVILASLSIPTAMCVARVFFDAASIERELTATKAAVVFMNAHAGKTSKARESSEDVVGKNASVGKANGNKLVFAVKISVSVVAVLLIVVGIFGGGMADVLSKAIKICTECIGLG